MGLLQEYLLMLLIVVCWLLVGFLRPVTPAVVPDQRVENVTTIAPKSIKEIEKEINGILNMVTKMALPYFVRNSDLKLSGSCMSTFIKIFVDLKKMKLPAIKLIDANAKPPFGLLKGNFAIMGDYDECLSIRATKKGDVAMKKEEEFYHGQYCTVEADFPPNLLKGMKDYGDGKANLSDFGKMGTIMGEFPGTNFAGRYFKFHIGICLPSTCSPDDLKEMLGLVPVDFVPLRVSRCEDNENKPLLLEQLIFLIALILLGSLVVAGTFTDVWLHLRGSFCKASLVLPDKIMQFFLAFSLYSNTKKLMKTDKSSNSDVTAINGMFVTGTFLVIVYHTYFLPFFLVFTSNSSNLGHYIKDFDFTLIVTMGISIEAYFLFSGLLLVYPRFRKNQKTININVIQIIIRRYIRLCPSMLIILGIIVVLPLIGSGPVWVDIFEVAAENTRKWWWTYVLMFNNFLPIKDLNFLYLWFIPCLMQISIVGAILLWFIAKSPKVGICLTIAAGLACNTILGVITALRHYPPAYAIYYFHKREQFEEPIYTSPLSHASSYGIGMILGYFMAKNQNLKWSRIHVVFGWIVSLFLTVGIQFIMYAGRDGRDPDPILAAVYGATHRMGFSLGLSWIILACTHGYGGAFGKLMKWKGFGPLSKLGYFGYLIHYIVIVFHVSVTRNPIVYSHYEIWMRIFAYTMLTFLAAYVLYITFELPLTFVESLFLPSRSEDTKNNTQQNMKNEGPVIIHYNGVNLANTIKTIANGNGVSYLGTIPGEHSKL